MKNMSKCLRYIVLFVLLLVSQFSGAQSKKTSSFSRTGENSLLESANYYIEINPALAFDYAVQALEVSIKSKDRLNEGNSYIAIGDINYKVEQFDLALDNYNKALAIFLQIENKEKEVYVKSLIAKAYGSSNDFEKSEALYKQSVEEAQTDKDNRRLKKSKKDLANIYQKQGEEDKAIQELEEVRKMDISDGDSEQQYLTNKALIRAYSSMEPSRALELTDENEAFATALKDTAALISTLQEKAIVYKNIGNTDEQLNALQQSLEVRKQQNDLEGISEDNLKISEVLLEQELIDDAIAYLEESIELSDRTGEIEIKKKALKSLSSAYDRTGDYNKAYTVYKDYVATAEQSAQLREQKILENLKLMQSFTKRLQRLDMLENQKLLSNRSIELLEQERLVDQRSLRQQKTIILTLGLGMLVLFIAIYLIYKSSQQKRVANQLLALRSLRSQMNPHFIFNALNSVNSYISKSDERSANKYLTDFSKLMRSVMENSKFDFVSLASEVQILELYLKLENHRFKEKFDYSFHIDPDIDQENIQIPPMLIQPYIENAIWHGLRYKEEKGYLKVELKNGENLKVIIEDNGIGRKKSMELKTKNQQESVSTGLKNINNRLQIINQIHKINLQVKIEDLDKQNQSGTRVTLDVIQSNV